MLESILIPYETETAFKSPSKKCMQYYSKTFLKRLLKKETKMFFKTVYHIMKVKSIAFSILSAFI